MKRPQGPKRGTVTLRLPVPDATDAEIEVFAAKSRIKKADALRLLLTAGLEALAKQVSG